MTQTAHNKSQIRKNMKKHRAAIGLSDYRSWSMDVIERCKMLREWKESRIVHIYVSSKNNEVDTIGFIISMLEGGKHVVVPRCTDGERHLENIRIKTLDSLKPSTYGLLEPEHDPVRIVRPDQFDIIIIPLLAFDRRGGRIGFGGGYYDTLLEQCSCTKVGLAYSFQEVEKAPCEDHDITLDIIVTEKETIRSCDG
ncbi:5-formyltetrahydrofolate cyclo-ligase [Candidatus Omnitrophota bacterium]